MQDFGFQYRVHSASISGANNLYKDKADAWYLQKQWYQSFLRKQPASPNDLVFWDLINNGIDWFFNDRYKNMMKKDFRDNGLKVFHYWVKQRHKYQLSFRDILFYFLLGLKQRSRLI